jgi:hypothetical protein
MNVFKRTKKKAWSTIGNYRCKSFVWHCITCETYKFKDTYGRFPHTFEEVWEWAQPFRKADDEQ